MFPLLHIDTFISKLSKINSLEHGTPWAWVLYRISNGGLWRTSCEIAHADRGQCTHPVWGVSKVELQTGTSPFVWSGLQNDVSDKELHFRPKC